VFPKPGLCRGGILTACSFVWALTSAVAAQTPAAFPELRPAVAADLLRPWVECAALKFTVSEIESRASDERIVTFRLNSHVWPTVQALFRWSYSEMTNWDRTGFPPGVRAFDCFLDAVKKGPGPIPFDARSKRAMDDIRSLAVAVECYFHEHNEYPAADMHDLWKKLVPDYTRQVPTLDPWGHPYVFRLEGQDPSHYVILSAGADGDFQTTEEETLRLACHGVDLRSERGAQDDPAADLVYIDGTFLRWHNLEHEARTELPRHALPCPPDVRGDGKARQNGPGSHEWSCPLEPSSKDPARQLNRFQDWPEVAVGLLNQTGMPLEFAICTEESLLFQGNVAAALPPVEEDWSRPRDPHAQRELYPSAGWSGPFDPQTRYLAITERKFCRSTFVFPVQFIRGHAMGYSLVAEPDGISAFGVPGGGGPR
jgi:hypothetical protein